MKKVLLSQEELGIALSCLEPNLAYNLPLLIPVGKHDFEDIKKALLALLAKHPQWNTRVATDENGELVKYIVDEPLNLVEGGKLDKEALVRPFVLFDSCLYRMEFYKEKEGNFLFVDFHHVIMDGFSLNRFFDDLAALLEGKEAKEEKVTCFQDAEDKLAQRNDKAAYEEDKKYFEDRFGAIDLESLPTQDKQDEGVAYKVIHRSLKGIGDKEVSSYLKAHNIRRSSFFLGGFALTLGLYSFTDEATFLSVDNGRNEGTKESYGMFVRTFPVYIDKMAEGRISDFLAKVDADKQQTLQRKRYSYGDLVKDYGYNADILFAYQGDYFYRINLDGKTLPVEQLPVKDGKEKLSIELFRKDGAYEIHAEYRSDLFEEDSIAHLLDSFAHIVSELLVKENLEDIVPTSKEDEKLLASYNAHNLEGYDLNRDFVDDIRDNLKNKKDKLAIVLRDKKLTYGELSDQATRLADYIIEKGYPKDSVVSVLINRNAFMGIATIGILLSGLAYQPLDPSYPDERLSFMIEDAEAKLVICDRGLESKIPSYKGEILFTDEIEKLPLKNLPQPKSDPHDMYIMLYTSGSTGKPKGVQLEHHNISMFVQWQRKEFGFVDTDKVSAYASYGFDANMYDIYAAFCNGLTLYVIDEEMRLDLSRLNKYLIDNGVTYAMMTTQVGRQFVEFEKNDTLKLLMVGGEKLVPIAPPGSYTLLNGYGPTECTIMITGHRVDKLYYRVPVGKGLDINHLYVLDKKMRPLPYGVPGYLYASGPQVARGYKNRPEENAKAFLDNPFEGGNFAKMYYTGDVVRFLKDGTVDFIGRKDGQVKIRGFRIELTEVERVLREFPGVKDATVNAYNAPSGGMFIAGYVVGDKPLDLEAIKAFVGERKPYYMVPEAMMQLDSIPLNQNQKVNKRALPVPTLSSAPVELVAPTNEKEKGILDIAKEVVGGELGITNDLFEAGLTSISSIRFMSLLSSRLNLDISIKDLREHSTVKELAKLGGEAEEAIEELDKYPLTKTQEGIFVEMMAHKDSTIYNIPLIYHLDKGIDVDKLANAIVKAIDNHPGLKSHLEMDGADVAMVPGKEEAKVEIRHEMPPSHFVLEPFDLFKGPLYRARIYVYEGGATLYLDTHHIASDGTSLAVLIEDIDNLYLGKEIVPEKRNAFAIALKEKKASTEEELKKQKEYYASFLSGIDSPSVPRKEYGLSDKANPLTYEFGLKTDKDKVGATLSKLGIGPNGFFNAVFAYALAKWNGNDDALFTSIYSGRDDASSARTVTMLVKTLPVYVNIDPKKEKSAFLKEVDNQLKNSQLNTLYSFADVSHDFDVKADVMFAYQGDGFLPSSIGGLPAKMETLIGDEAKAAFSVDCLLKEDGYHLHFEYPANLYLEQTMEYFARLFDLVCSSLCKEGNLSDIVLIDEGTAKEMDVYNQTSDPLEEGDYLDYFAEQVKKHPSKKAIVGIDETLTYEEFDKRGNKVANALIEFGIKPDDKVVTLTKRIANAYVAREGVLKSGGAFVPIDPAYPDDRISYIIEDSGAKAVLTTRDIYEAKKDSYPGAKFLLLEDLLASSNDKDPHIRPAGNNLAYCIFTSGSTGKPKGVMIERHSLYNFVTLSEHNAVAHEYVDKNDVTASLASLSFDLSVQEEFIPFAQGMTNVLASEEEILNPVMLAKRMIENGVTIITTTPSYVNNVLDIEDVMVAFRKLNNIDLGAEAIPASLIEKMRAKGMETIVGNGYGPTEATVTCTFDYVTSPRITIGYPLNNVKTFIIDKEGRRLPFGAIGELLIGGNGVARGYIHRDDLNKEKFIDFEGVYAYRSGDLARINYDGRIEFFGRKDNQVKLRGLRVELDEIENAIGQVPGISRSVVLVKESPEEGQYLVGYYLSEKEIPVENIKEVISKSLTPYMIPKVFVHLDNIPMTQNGKVDKKALPEPVVKRDAVKMRLPKNKTQQDIYDIFVHVLGVKELSIDDDFFDLGGSSLSASKVAMLAIEKNLPISYGDIFDNPTVADLAALVNASSKAATKEEEALVEIEEGLTHNTVAEVNDMVKEKEFHNVLLTGANGFLGIHVLAELLKKDDIHIIALVRGSKGISGKDRLLALMAYYFDDPLEDEVEKKVTVIESDVTSMSLLDELKNEKFELIINCAALVKHFAADDSIERVNLGGVKNLIGVALAHNARMVQVSTLSVAGENVGGKFPREKRIHEYEIYFGQDISNKYINSKIKAEQAMIEAVNKSGLDGKVVRVGNLMGRNKDGEFQANSSTNNFMNSLRAYVKLGAFPVSAADSTIDFSPIDEVAKTILLLASAPSKYTIFHSANSHEVELGDVITALNDYGYHIDIVPDEVFEKRLAEFMADEKQNMAVSSLISYNSSSGVSHEFILSDNSFTVKSLYRLGYKWPITDRNYLNKSIASLATLGFFE